MNETKSSILDKLSTNIYGKGESVRGWWDPYEDGLMIDDVYRPDGVAAAIELDGLRTDFLFFSVFVSMLCRGRKILNVTNLYFLVYVDL